MMGRLTYKSARGAVSSIYAEDFTLDMDDATYEGYSKVMNKLAHYEDLEEAGRLIELPCKIGDTVYGSFQCYGGEKIHECKVVAIKAYKNNDDPECYYFVHVKFDIIDPFYNDGRVTTYGGRAVIGKNFGSWNRVFFTLAEAEAALKERESE